MEKGGPDDDEVSLEVAIERVRKIRLENKAEDSDSDSDTNHQSSARIEDKDETPEPTNTAMISTEGSRQLVKASEVGTDYYRSRQYKGLDPKVSSETPPDTRVVQGQSGLPVSYTHGER